MTPVAGIADGRIGQGEGREGCQPPAPAPGHEREPSKMSVECYSGHTYAQELRALTWEGHRYPVAEIEARWRTPAGPVFQLRTGSGERFEVSYSELEDRWTIRPLEQPNP